MHRWPCRHWVWESKDVEKATRDQKQRSTSHSRGKGSYTGGERNRLASSGSNCMFGESGLRLRRE